MIDAAEFTDLVDQSKAQALTVANAILHRSDIAHDVVADAMALAWIHRTQFRGDGTLEAWFLRIVKNRAMEWRRRLSKHMPGCNFDVELPLWQLDSGDNIETAMIAREWNAQVRCAVRRIPAFLRSPILLVYWEDLGPDAAAERLEISRAAFKTRLARGKRMFQANWQGVA